jgi:hypothetical protein
VGLIVREWLVVRTEKAAHWRTEKPDASACVKDITPRKNRDEKTKSAWACHAEGAYFSSHAQINAALAIAKRGELLSQSIRSVLIRLPPVVPVEIQAVSLLVIHAASNPDQSPLSSIHLLVIDRDKLGLAVYPEADEHIVEAYDRTHSGIDSSDRIASIDAVQKLVRGTRHGMEPNYRVETYTRDELRPLLSELLEARLLRTKFHETAKRIVALP